VDPRDLSKAVDASKIRVTMKDFERALAETSPAFGANEEELSSCFSNGVYSFSDSFADLHGTMQKLVEQVRNSARTNLMSVLLTGTPGSGKTAFTAKLGADSKFPFVKRIGADTLVGYSEQGKCGQIVKVFEDAYRSPLSMIILDDIERIIEYVSVGMRFSNAVLQTLLVLCKRPPPTKGRKLMVVGTTGIPSLLEQMELAAAFQLAFPMPLVTGTEEVRAVLEADGCVDAEHVEGVASQVLGSIGIKRLLMVLELAKDDDGRVDAASFAEALVHVGIV
jgi:vesicle-fusing ATPase